MDYADFNKMFSLDFLRSLSGGAQMPFDSNAFAETMRKNVEVFSEAQQKAMEDAQAAMQRQTRLWTQMAESNAEIAREVMNEGTPEQKVAKQTALLRQSYENSVSALRELADMLETSNKATSELINKRIAAALNEIQNSFEKPAPADKKAA
ncbi:MAG: phasin family protein [Alphaproteobacteria bacterium]|nr:phasin family protein [Alphaproteobacteria bacterium]